MTPVEHMNVLAYCSKSKTNKDLAIIAGIGILVVGGICYYYYIQNQELKQRQQTYAGQMSEMSSRIYSLQESNRSLQMQINEHHKRRYELMNTIKKLETDLFNKG